MSDLSPGFVFFGFGTGTGTAADVASRRDEKHENGVSGRQGRAHLAHCEFGGGVEGPVSRLPWQGMRPALSGARRPSDRRRLTARPSVCLCQMYKPGPGESLSNFDVHLKNRSHRGKVSERLERATAKTAVVVERPGPAAAATDMPADAVVAAGAGQSS